MAVWIAAASSSHRSASEFFPKARAITASATRPPYAVAERSGHTRGREGTDGHLRASPSGQRLGIPDQRGLLSCPVSQVQKPSQRPYVEYHDSGGATRPSGRSRDRTFPQVGSLRSLAKVPRRLPQ